MKKIIVILLSILTFSCNSDEDNTINEHDYSQYFSDNSIDTDIKFNPGEYYNNASTAIEIPNLQLLIRTIEVYPLQSYQIGLTQFFNGNEIIIRFDEIIEGLAGSYPSSAKAYVDLPEDTNKITFINGTVVDKYTIEITEEKVITQVIESHFTTLGGDNMFRYPENSFAYICEVDTNDSNTSICGDFLAILEQNPNITEFQFQGEGIIPYQESVVAVEENYVREATYFIYENESDFDELGQILDDFTIQNIPDTGLDIHLHSWKNKKHLSWD